MANTDDKDFTEAFESIKDIPTDDPEISEAMELQSRQALMELALYQTDAGTRLQSEWQEAESSKLFDERRFVRSLRQYRGIYDPEILTAIHPNRSKAFIRLTRTKVKTYDARMMDIKFPSNDDKDWNIQSTAVPELSPIVVKQVAEQMMAASGGKPPTAEDVQQVMFDESDERAIAMEDEINDQLQEFDYRRVIRNVVHSGHLYGTGILKGPMVKEKIVKRWHQVGTEWKQIKITRLVPTAQFVSIWDIYPDMSAKELKDCRYIWQKHMFSKNNLYKLSKRSDFDSNAILAYLEAHKEGNAVYKQYEDDLREMSSNSKSDGDTSPPKKEKFEVHERWGFMDIDDAKTILPNVDDETWASMGPEVACNIWLIDNYIIKAVISPVESSEFPYYFYYYDKDETSIFGDGIPEIMRDPQTLYNAGTRAMLDNAAIAAGPIIEANVDMLADGEDPTELFPFRTFQRIGTGIEANAQAIRVTKLPSYTNEFLNLVQFFQTTADESTTIPRAMSGLDQAGGAASRTATGMSMLMGAANITLKDQVHYFDEGVTKPFIMSMYFWNMEFNTKEHIKGDFDIVARGSKSLMAKEVKMEQINQFLTITNNPIDNQYIKRDVLLRELAEVFDLDKLGFVRTEDEVMAKQKADGVAGKRQQDMDMMLEAMKAESSGHVPDAVAKTMKMFNIQLPGGTPPVNTGEVQENQIG